jgi:hypothetical protein
VTRPRRDDRGSVALVVMVLFVMASLAAIVVSRSVEDAREVRRSQDRADALALTDVGLAAGSARATLEPAATFADSGSIDGGTWTSSAQRVNPFRWQISVDATIHGATRQVSAALVLRGGSGWVVADWQEA